VPLSQQLRQTAEFHLRAAAEDDMIRRHPERAAARRDDDTVTTLFWRDVFVPLYRRLPWWLRLSALRAMPGSHHRRWKSR
jgi:hypothetical protein